jgi:hypothetical protein
MSDDKSVRWFKRTSVVKHSTSGIWHFTDTCDEIFEYRGKNPHWAIEELTSENNWYEVANAKGDPLPASGEQTVRRFKDPTTGIGSIEVEPAASGEGGEGDSDHRPVLLSRDAWNELEAKHAALQAEVERLTVDIEIYKLAPEKLSRLCDEQNKRLEEYESQLAEREREIERYHADDDQVMRERDGYHDMLDKFVYALGGTEVHGEHSSLNDPWQSALDFAEELMGQVIELRTQLEAERRAREGLARAVSMYTQQLDEQKERHAKEIERLKAGNQ